MKYFGKIIQLVILIGIFTFVFFVTPGKDLAGLNNSYTQGGKWNKQENDKCGSGCVSYDPTYGGLGNLGGVISSYGEVVKIFNQMTAKIGHDPPWTLYEITGQQQPTIPLECVGVGCVTTIGTIGPGGFTTTGYSISGFYYSSITGKYYPIGTGPYARTARSGAVITPVPTPGIVHARAYTTLTIPETCDEIFESTMSGGIYRNGTSFNLLKGTINQGTRTQNGSAYVSWTLTPNTYKLVPLSPGTSSLRSCLTDETGQHFGPFDVTLASAMNDYFDIAYGPPPAWFQVQGGDAYSKTNISSLTEAGAVPRYFALDGTGGYPGIVTYGGAPTDYDFTAESGSKGTEVANRVSSQKWLVNDQNASRTFYPYFFAKLGAPTTADYTDLTDPLPQPPYDATKKVYYIKGDMTTSGTWTAGDDQNLVFLVDGNLTIGNTVNITGAKGNGFIAFIASGNITISSNVGGAYNSASPQVEGVYVSDGTLFTGKSTVAGKERFVGKGMFISNAVTLQRDLIGVVGGNQNANYSAELFIYNPALLIEMPDAFKYTPVRWQEVAP